MQKFTKPFLEADFQSKSTKTINEDICVRTVSNNFLKPLPIQLQKPHRKAISLIKHVTRL